MMLTLEQKGGWISGTAILWVPREDGGQNNLEGAVDGTIDDDHFTMKILWNNDQTGFYVARILPTGRLEGDGWEKNTPKVRLAWHSEEVLKCGRPSFPANALPTFTGAAPPPKSPPPPPLKATGKARSSEPAAPPKPPFITGGQAIVQPYVPVASVYLGWDAGPDHPNAEVVAVNEDGQTLMFKEVFKKPKAGIELRLQRGRQYIYVLKDGGVTLSTVNLVVP